MEEIYSLDVKYKMGSATMGKSLWNVSVPMLLFIASFSSCVACLIITVFILDYGSFIILEPNKAILTIEFLIALISVEVNVFVLFRHFWGVFKDGN